MAHGYPVEILPKKKYELRLDILSILKVYPNLYVSRRIDGAKDDLTIEFDGDRVLSDRALNNVCTANFSVNLLGALFDTNRHIHYRPFMGAFTDNWDGSELQFEISDDMYEKKEPCFAVYYNVKDFLEFPMKQTVQFQKENDYIAFRAKATTNGSDEKYFKAFEKGETIEFPVTQRANHMPTCCNYWHVTFDTYSFDDPNVPIDSRDSRSTIKRVLKFLRHEFLTRQGIVDVPANDAIPSCFYCHNWNSKIMRKLIIFFKNHF